MPRDHATPAAPSRQAPAAPDNAIEIRDVSKVYAGRHGQAEKRALDGVSIDIPRGSFFGLLGPNGAGKSTLINIMAGLVTKTSGSVRIWDYDIDKAERAARLAIGIVPQELNLDPFFTPRELLEVQAGLYGVPKSDRRTDEILHLVGLTDKADSYARTLSGGMRRRLLVAKAMVHAPPILVLDEPTAGVDIELRQQLWEQVKLLNEQGTTILLTTHYLEEAEELCDRIAIINQGTVAVCEPKRTLLQRLDNKALHVTVRETVGTVPPALAAHGAELADEHKLVIRYHPSKTVLGDVLEAFRASDLSIIDLSTEEADLEDIFLQLTSQPDAARNRPTP